MEFFSPFGSILSKIGNRISGDCRACSHDGDANSLPAGKLLNANFDGDVPRKMKLSCWCHAARKAGRDLWELTCQSALLIAALRWKQFRMHKGSSIQAYVVLWAAQSSILVSGGGTSKVLRVRHNRY